MEKDIDKRLRIVNRIEGVSNDIFAIGQVVLDEYKRKSDSLQSQSTQDYLFEKHPTISKLSKVIDDVKELNETRLKGETILTIDEILVEYQELRELTLKLAMEILDVDKLPELYESRYRKENIDKLLEK